MSVNTEFEKHALQAGERELEILKAAFGHILPVMKGCNDDPRTGRT